MKEYKNFFDHFRKTKYTENLIRKVIAWIRGNFIKIELPKKICVNAIAYFRRFYFLNNILEYKPYHVAVVCIFLSAKVGEISHLKSSTG